MRIIDPHVHVWKNDPAFPFAPEVAHPPEEDATAEMLLELMAQHGVEKTVLVQVIHYRWDNRYTAHVLKQYPDTFMGVCRVNPEDPDAPDQLSRLVEVDGFHGVRLSPATGPEGDWFTGPLMDPLFRRASDLGVPMLILTRPSRLPDLAVLLERHPDLDVCIDHMADCPPDDDEAAEQQLLDLARFPRVYVKISHTWAISKKEDFPTVVGVEGRYRPLYKGGSYPWRDTWGLVERVYRAFGGPRIMWGTDWPVCLRHATYGQTLSVVRDEMDMFAPEDMEWILGKTALRLWPFE